MTIALLVLSLAVLVYVFAGYPLLLRLTVWLRGPRRVHQADVTPSISLVISAYNEEAVIASKLDNALGLDYPRDRLEVVVISDASSDGTDAIVAGYADRGVILARQPERLGKTAGLNRTLPMLHGEIVVFSDANAMYERNALRMLARNFADPEVGCVTGEARYIAGNRAAADVGERMYWGYEIQVKRLETALGSMVGGDGAIYAIRRALWTTLPDDAINDFLNPLQIVVAGWRNVYDPEAVCHEETTGTFGAEYKRRVRIVSRSWRAVFQARQALNPFRVGLFAWSVISHKVLRWFSGLFAALAGLSALALLIDFVARRPVGWLLALIAAMALSMAVPVLRRSLAMVGYFVVINGASLVGILQGTVGRVSPVWSTPRQFAADHTAGVPRTVPVGTTFLAIGALSIASGIVALPLAPAREIVVFTFWSSLALLGYIYAGYPLLLAISRRVWHRPVRTGPGQPSVCLLVAANDEAAVIEAKLSNALALDYPADRFDIVVASDGSVDSTNDIVRRFAPRVRLLALSPRRGKIAAINAAIKTVTADVVVFSDANTFLEPDAIKKLVRNFHDDEVGAVSGDVALVGERAALGRSEDLYYRYERWVQRAESESGSMIGADGALYAVRRELFVPPAEDTILDDMAIPMAVIRANRRVVFEPEARAYEHGSESAREEFARKSRVIAGAMQFLQRHDSAVPVNARQVILSLISHKGLRWFSPAFATTAFLSSVILAGASHGYAAAAIAQSSLLLTGLGGCVPALRRINVIALAHYFCLVQAAAGVGFLRGLSGRQSVLWRRFERASANDPYGVLQ